MENSKRKISADSHSDGEAENPIKKVKSVGFGKPPAPNLGYQTYKIADPDSWYKVFKASYLDPIRPAMIKVEMPYKRYNKQAKQLDFSLSASENPKEDQSEVKINQLFKTSGIQDIYYSKENPKFTKETEVAREKIAFDDFDDAHQKGFATDALRVMKGTANTKGFTSKDTAAEKRAAISGSLIMTSERTRNPLNPINASIELYKVKHGQKDLHDVFDVKEGSFIAAQSDGAEKSRKWVDEKFLKQQMNSKEMKNIFDSYASTKEKHKGKDFDQWVDYKTTKLVNRFNK